MLVIQWAAVAERSGDTAFFDPMNLGFSVPEFIFNRAQKTENRTPDISKAPSPLRSAGALHIRIRFGTVFISVLHDGFV